MNHPAVKSYLFSPSSARISAIFAVMKAKVKSKVSRLFSSTAILQALEIKASMTFVDCSMITPGN